MTDSIGAYEAKTHLPRLLDGRPVARLVPIASGREKAREALARNVERRGSVKLTPFAELGGQSTKATDIDARRSSKSDTLDARGCRLLRIPGLLSCRGG